VSRNPPGRALVSKHGSEMMRRKGGWLAPALKATFRTTADPRNRRAARKSFRRVRAQQPEGRPVPPPTRGKHRAPGGVGDGIAQPRVARASSVVRRLDLRQFYRRLAHALGYPDARFPEETDQQGRGTLWAPATQLGRLPVLAVDDAHLLAPACCRNCASS